MKILGISAFYHDSAATLIINGQIIAACQEERFTRKKHDASFPMHSIKFCLEKANLDVIDLDYVVFYEKPLLKFERLIESYLSVVPKGFFSFLKAMPVWLKEKLFFKKIIREKLKQLTKKKKYITPKILFTQHHQSHAASAFFASPFREAIILCLDGVGEWATSTVWIGKENKIIPKLNIDFPHSLGLLYSSFTYFLGFKVNSGEYKLMGLAPYGKPIYTAVIKKYLILIKPDGSFRLNMKYFNYVSGLTMTNKKFERLFKCKVRKPETDLLPIHMDLASSIQEVINEILIKISENLKKKFQINYLCLAGGVALNCVSNGKILEKKIFKDIWIQPAAGDAGGSLGAALYTWYQFLNNKRIIKNSKDIMQGGYLGSEYSNKEIKNFLDEKNIVYSKLSNTSLYKNVASLINDGKVIGWFSGKMEFGPRALGNRSIIGDPRDQNMQKKMNIKIKFRESFRPFAPAIMEEKINEWFDINSISPYMLLVAKIKSEKLIKLSKKNLLLQGLDKLNVKRSKVPAITHVDCSARIQSVNKQNNKKFYELIKEFDKLTGCPILINTSFNVRGEPIVCTLEDAFRCFMSTEMDYLVLENFLLSKSSQKVHNIKSSFSYD